MSILRIEKWDCGDYDAVQKLMCYFCRWSINERNEHYRQNTYLDKILNNMKVISIRFIKTQCLVCKHNENHLQETDDLV